MDPISLVIAITSLVGIVLTFLLNLYQSVKSRHFESDCGFCSCLYDSEHQDKDDTK